MFNNQYAGKKVFITGNTGFKGSWMTSWLLEMGAKVYGYSLNVPSYPSAFLSLGLEEKISHTYGDVRDLAALTTALKQAKPHIIFHMAAQALVRPSYEDPCDTFSTNAMGTMNVLEAARNIDSLEAIICITSDKCYKNNEWEWGYRESDHLGGDDPYSASKACAEIIAHSYFRSFFKEKLATATVRAGNVIGGGDWATDRIVPDCARAFSLEQTVTLRNPHATRPWQHVLEPLSGYLWLGAKMLSGQSSDLSQQAFNFGPSAEINATVLQVTEALAKHWSGFKIVVENQDANKAKESTLLRLSCDKVLARLGWKATLDFDETIEFTAKWYKTFYLGEEQIYKFTANQISKYHSLAMSKGLLWAK